MDAAASAAALKAALYRLRTEMAEFESYLASTQPTDQLLSERLTNHSLNANDIVKTIDTLGSQLKSMQRNSEMRRNEYSQANEPRFEEPRSRPIQDIKTEIVDTLRPLVTNQAFSGNGIACVKIEGLDIPELDESPLILENVRQQELRMTKRNSGIPCTSIKIKPVPEHNETIHLPRLLSSPILRSWTLGQVREYFEHAASSDTLDTIRVIEGPFQMIQGYIPILGRPNCLIPQANRICITTTNSLAGVAMHKPVKDHVFVDLVLNGGPKLWLTVQPIDNDRLEQKLHEHFGSVMGTCSKAVEHLGLLIRPSLLDTWGVHYTLQACFPTQFVLLHKNAYRQSLSVGSNASEQVSLEIQGVSGTAGNIAPCQGGASCGIEELDQSGDDNNSIMGEHARRQNNRESPSSNYAPRRQNVGPNSASKRQRLDPAFVDLATKERRREEMEDLDLSSGLEFTVVNTSKTSFCLAASMLSRTVFERLHSLVLAWRRQGSFPLISFTGLPNDRATRVAMYDQNLRQCNQYTVLAHYISRLGKYHFVKEMDAAKGNRQSLETSFLDNVLRAMAINPTPEERRRLSKTVSRRRKWMNLCGPFGSGMLPLLPFHAREPYQVCDNLCNDLAEPSILAFVAHLQEPAARSLVVKLCNIGSLLEELVRGDTEFEFRFELVHNDSSNYDWLSQCDDYTIFRLFERAPYAKHNIFDEDLDWGEPPADWEREWPTDITKCSICQWCNALLGECECIKRLPVDRHRIQAQQNGARLLKARSQVRNEIVFASGDFIGELTGRLMPLTSTSHRHRSVATIYQPHTDALLPSENHPICLLRCEKASNWVRLVRHSDSPNAELVAQAVSGKIRLMLRALVDIHDDMEITIGDGPHRFRSTMCSCERCREEET